MSDAFIKLTHGDGELFLNTRQIKAIEIFNENQPTTEANMTEGGFEKKDCWGYVGTHEQKHSIENEEDLPAIRAALASFIVSRGGGEEVYKL